MSNNLGGKRERYKNVLARSWLQKYKPEVWEVIVKASHNAFPAVKKPFMRASADLPVLLQKIGAEDGKK